MLKVLILSFYYQPDLCAGSFRTTALVEELKQLPNIEIEIITTKPNRYASFDAEALDYEVDGNVTINRIGLPNHNSGMFDQVRSFATFYRRARTMTNSKQYDLVYATSSRLFTAFLGARVAKRKKLPLYLDIRDIFVDTINDVLPAVVTFVLKPILTFVEKYTFTAAKHINLVSKGFEQYFIKRFSQCSYSYFTNGIDSEFLNVAADSDVVAKSAPVKILYAGNIGEGQGLHTILSKLAPLAGDQFQFDVIGDGGRKPILVEQSEGTKNITLYPPVDRVKLSKSYLDADILFLHLNDYPAFEKVLPSKIFEYAATGKPILAGVSGYAAEFIKEEVTNAQVFYPGNEQQALSALQKLKLTNTDRSEFIDKFTRKNIMQSMAKSIAELGVVK